MRRLILTLAFLWLLPTLAWSATQVSGLYMVDACSVLSASAAGKAFCFDKTANTLKRWNGTAWESMTPSGGKVVSVAEYGGSQSATGAVNDAAFVAALAAGAGGAVYVPPGTGCYRVTASIKPPANTTLLGDGYGSCIDIAAAGWTIVYGGTLDYAIVVARGSNTTLRGLRIKGSTTCVDTDHCPKLLGVYPPNDTTISNILIEDNYFQDQQHEGIHPNMNVGSYQIQNLRVVNNIFTNIGLNAAGTVANAGFAIELTAERSLASGNIITNSWGGIDVYGAWNTVVGNIISLSPSATLVTEDQRGIEAGGEGNPDAGGTTITGNTIYLNLGATHNMYGIRLVDTTNTNHPQIVSANSIYVYDNSATGQGAGIRVNASMAHITGNTIELYKRGYGIMAFGTTAGADITVADNTVRLTGETGGASFGFYATGNGAGKTLRITSLVNRVHGMDNATSFSHYFTTAGGTLTGVASHLFKSGGILHTDTVDLEAVADNVLLSFALPETASPHIILGTQITPGSGTGVTVNHLGGTRSSIYKVTVSYTNCIAAAVNCDVTIATLPAKTYLVQVLADLTVPYVCAATCTTATLTGTLGRTAGASEFLAASLDFDAAAALFGDADAELGTEMTVAARGANGAKIPGVLGSWTTTTTVVYRLTSGTGNLGTGTATNLNAGSVTFYLVTERMP